eukprot:scaffold4223_cov189-Amphora_coffeaeformis.AAC.29
MNRVPRQVRLRSRQGNFQLCMVKLNEESPHKPNRPRSVLRAFPEGSTQNDWPQKGQMYRFGLALPMPGEWDPDVVRPHWYNPHIHHRQNARHPSVG